MGTPTSQHPKGPPAHAGRPGNSENRLFTLGSRVGHQGGAGWAVPPYPAPPWRFARLLRVAGWAARVGATPPRQSARLPGVAGRVTGVAQGGGACTAPHASLAAHPATPGKRAGHWGGVGWGCPHRVPHPAGHRWPARPTTLGGQVTWVAPGGFYHFSSY